MYENMTFSVILQRMLGKISNSIDKREGSVVYDVSAASAVEFQNAYVAMDNILNETFADTASKPRLIKRCKERGIEVQVATNAIRKGEFNVDVPIGSRFSLNQLNYIAIEKISDGIFKMQCETAGVVGNAESGSLIPIDYIENLQTALLTDVLIPGEDEEDVEQLRKRYFNSFKSQSFGGNVADYKEKINAINGVGGVKIYRAMDSDRKVKGGSVKAVIIDSTYSKPSDVLVDAVQKEVDPIGHQGEGLGLAPIGHVVTVTGCGETKVDIQTKIRFQDGWDWEGAEPYIHIAIDDYFKELSKTWEESDKNDLIVRISQIESRLLNVTGVLDISDTLLNRNASNLSIDKDCVPIRGTVTNV